MSGVGIQLQRARQGASQAGALAVPGVQRRRGRSLVGQPFLSLRQEIHRGLAGTSKDALGCRLRLAGFTRGRGG
eukprot:1150813-Pleurochrysis_carterae.AAC.2